MSTRPQIRLRAALPALPIDRYRGLAAGLLAGLLLVAAFAPLTNPPPRPEAIDLPPFDGQPAPSLAGTLFNYPAENERLPAPAAHATILRVPGTGTALLNTLAGEMLIEDTDPEGPRPAPVTPTQVSEQVQPGGPARWNNLEQFYRSARDSWAANGLAIIETLRAAAAAAGGERLAHLNQALFWSDTAVNNGAPGIYNYNWALLHLALGDYQQAASGLEEVRQIVAVQSTAAPIAADAIRFYKGVALLRLGEPQAALDAWRAPAAGPVPDWSDAIAEGSADALAASGDAPGALAAYSTLQDKNPGVDWGLYEKQVRLALDQAGAEGALALSTALAGRYPTEARLHYDQGRLLLFLGRLGPAAAAFRAALALQADDPAYHAGLAETALAAGDAPQALAESEAVLRAEQLDPGRADLTLTYGKLDNPSVYERSVGQIVLDANVVRAAALARLGQPDRVRALAAGAEAQGAGGDTAKAAWFRYYAGLIYAAGGLPDEALARFKPAGPAGSPSPGPGLGPLLLGWVRTLTPAQARLGAGAITLAAGGQPGAPAFPPDAATATAYATLAQKLEGAGAAPDAGPFYHAAAVWEAAQDAMSLQPPLGANGTLRATPFRLAQAAYLRRQGVAGVPATTRYQQVLDVAPALTTAHVDRGVAYYQAGDRLRAQRDFELALRSDPAGALAAHNLNVLALDQGPAGLGQVLVTLATMRLAATPATLPGDTGILAAPAPPGASLAPPVGFGTRLPALLCLLLLLFHTLIPIPRGAPVLAAAAPAVPEGSLLSRWGLALAARLPAGAPGSRAAAGAVGGAAIVGGLGWAWALSSNGWLLALALAPLTIAAALLALGAQEAVQWLVVRRERRAGSVQTRIWPLGLLLSLAGAPLGLFYGWLVTTQAGAVEAPPAAAGRRTAARQEPGPPPAGEDRVPWRSWGALGPPARVALAGLAANLLLAIVFAVVYGQLGSGLWRILLLGNVAVLAFTAVSDRDADGWHLWRRSPLLWLILFAAAAAALTVLLLGVW